MNRNFWWIMSQAGAITLLIAVPLGFTRLECFVAFAVSAVMNAAILWRARRPRASLDPADFDDDHLP
jgi:membrane protein implicated in regulation of membrane protease activity